MPLRNDGTESGRQVTEEADRSILPFWALAVRGGQTNLFCAPAMWKNLAGELAVRCGLSGREFFGVPDGQHVGRPL